MRVYVAAKFEEKARAQATMRQLKAAGHIITHDWTAEDDTNIVDDPAKQKYWGICGEQDINGVLAADAVVVLNHPELYGGMVEVGAALAFALPVIVVGADIRNTVFWWVKDAYRVDDVAQAVALMQLWKEESEASWEKVG